MKSLSLALARIKEELPLMTAEWGHAFVLGELERGCPPRWSLQTGDFADGFDVKTIIQHLDFIYLLAIVNAIFAILHSTLAVMESYTLHL